MSLPNPSAPLEETLHDFDGNMMAALNNLQVDDAPSTGATAPKTLFGPEHVETDIVEPLGSPFVTPSSTSAPSLQNETQQLIPGDDVNLHNTSTPASANNSWFRKRLNSVAKMTATLTSTPSASKSVSFRNEASTFTFPASSTVPEVTPPPSAPPSSTDNAEALPVPPASNYTNNTVFPSAPSGENTSANGDATTTVSAGNSAPDVTDAHGGAVVVPPASLAPNSVAMTGGGTPNTPTVTAAATGFYTNYSTTQNVAYQNPFQGFASSATGSGWFHQGAPQTSMPHATTQSGVRPQGGLQQGNQQNSVPQATQGWTHGFPQGSQQNQVPQYGNQQPSMSQSSVPNQGGTPGFHQHAPQSSMPQSSVPNQGGTPGFHQHVPQSSMPQSNFTNQGGTSGFHHNAPQPSMPHPSVSSQGGMPVFPSA